MYVNLLLLVIFAACFASTVSNGLWTNMLLLINMITAGLVATCYYEPVADFLDDVGPGYSAAWDFVSVWLLFALAMALFSFVTDVLSRARVRFLKPIDQAGGILLCCWISWAAVCFVTFTLHMAPLPRSFAGGDFQPRADSRMLLKTAPDHRWLGFASKMSRGGFYRGKSHEFDPRAEFIYMYAQRRLGLEKGASWALPAKPGAPAAGPPANAAPAGEK
jgi:Colicin V production protein